MSAKFTLRAFEPSDLEFVLRANHESVHFLSPMDEQRLQLILSWSAQISIAESDGQAAGFLVTFGDGSDYDSLNYRWFADHLKRFVYIDRIVVDQNCRGAGIGQQIYSNLLSNNVESSGAKKQQALWLAAEVDIEPRNDYSLNFHQKQGFVEVGRQSGGQGKQVSLQVRSI